MATLSASVRESGGESRDDRERRLGEVIAAYLEEVEAGRGPDHSALMARHPDLAGELVSFFANREHLERITAPWRDEQGARGSPALLPFTGSFVDGDDRPGRAPSPPGTPEGSAGRVGYFGDYELVEVIAEGGMGVVFRARQVSLDRVLALKMIRAGRFATADDVQRFRLEAEAAARLDHPNIVPIHGVGEHDGHPYYSMKLVDGGSLAARVGHYAGHPRAVAALVATVAKAVHYAHQRGILHRDLKPANILLSAPPGEPPGHWVPLVADFGLAKRVEGPQAGGPTRSGAIVGTPGYMAPEQAGGAREAITTAVDVHALGAILYELLTGRPPFRADTVLETLRLVREQEPARPRSIDPRIDRDLETIALQCLEKAPSRRYASAEALADDLDRWLAGRPIQARPASVSERLVKWSRRRPALAGLMLVGMVAISASAAAIAGLLAWNDESYRRRQAEDRVAEAGRAQERLTEDDYFHRILAAQQSIADHDPDKAGRLLDECPAAYRGWEWQHLMARLHSEIRVIRGHTAFVCASDFTPVSRQVACRGGILPGSVWHAATTTAAAPAVLGADTANSRLHGLDGTAYGLALDRSGTRLATAAADGLVRVWNVTDAKMTHLIRAHAGWVVGVAFSPDGARIATAGEDAAVRIWDIGPGSGEDGRMRHELTGHEGPVFGVAFSPDGVRIASAGSDGTVRVWEPGHTPAATSVLRGHDGAAIAVAFHPDGSRLASGGADRRVRLWDLASGREHASFHAATRQRISALAYHPDGKWLAVGGHDRSVAIWDTVTPQRLIDYPGHSGPVLHVAFSPGGEVLASASQDATIKLWDPGSEPGGFLLRVAPATALAGDRTGRDERRSTEPLRWVGGVAFAPSGDELAAAGTEEVVAAWDAAGRVRRLHRGGMGPMIGVAYRPDGLALAAAGTDRTARIWNLRRGGDPIVLSDAAEGFSSLAFHPRGGLLATGGGDPPRLIQVPQGKGDQPASDGRTIRLWDSATGQGLRSLRGHVGSVHALAFNREGTRLASAGADRVVRLWDPNSGRLLATLEGHSGSVFALAFRPDGSELASAGFDRVIRIWDVGSGRTVRMLAGHDNWVLGLAFSPDGERLASAGADATVRLWDPARGREALVLRGPLDRVHGVAFSPDSSRLAAASADGLVRVWEAMPP